MICHDLLRHDVASHLKLSRAFNCLNELAGLCMSICIMHG